MNIGRTIKILRVGLNIRQRDLAKRLDMSSNYIYLVENGKREPSLAFLKDVSRALGVPVSFLFLDEDIRPTPGKESKEIYEKIKSLIIEVQKLANANENKAKRD